MFKCDRRATLTVKIIKGPRAGRGPAGGVDDRGHMCYAQKLTSFLRTRAAGPSQAWQIPDPFGSSYSHGKLIRANINNTLQQISIQIRRYIQL